MDMLAKVNWIDILAVIITVRISYVAMQDGLSHEIFPLISAILTLALDTRYYHDLALAAQHMTNLSISILDPVVFIVLAICLGMVFKILKLAVDVIVKVTWHPFVEKFGGLIAGITRASIVMSIMLIAMSLLPFSYFKYSVKDRSLSGPYFLNIAYEVSGKLSWALPAITKNR